MPRTAIAYLPAHADTADERDVLARLAGLELVGIVADACGGLAMALDRIAKGEAKTLLVSRLSFLGGSLRALVGVFGWLDAVGADLLALDVRLDTGTPMGRRMAATLREVESWERDPQLRSPRGRPGLAAREPELTGRISAMRERGLSLQAIADSLNADGLPTLRGGARWRPSSVQAALGYRRPRPPAPGAPPPPPPPPAPQAGPAARAQRARPGGQKPHRRAPHERP